MAVQKLPVGGRKTVSATGTNAIDAEFVAQQGCSVDIGITKPTGAVLTVRKTFAGGAPVDLIVSADATTATNVSVEGVRMKAGDQIEVDVDTTSGTKTVSAEAWRLA